MSPDLVYVKCSVPGTKYKVNIYSLDFEVFPLCRRDALISFLLGHQPIVFKAFNLVTLVTACPEYKILLRLFQNGGIQFRIT